MVFDNVSNWLEIEAVLLGKFLLQNLFTLMNDISNAKLFATAYAVILRTTQTRRNVTNLKPTCKSMWY